MNTTNISLFDKDLILFPSKHQSAIEAYLNVPLPDEEPLTATQKVLTLLQEIKRINFNIDFYQQQMKQEKLEELENMKDFFASMLQEIMATQFQVMFFKQAA